MTIARGGGLEGRGRGRAYRCHHEDIVFLLVANGELALCLLVVLRKGLELLDSRARRDRGCEFDVGFCVFVAGLERHQLKLTSEADINIHNGMDS